MMVNNFMGNRLFIFQSPVIDFDEIDKHNKIYSCILKIVVNTNLFLY